MKRSEINRAIADAKKFIARMKFQLPPFAFWTPQKWKRTGHEADEIRRAHLGWDVTDFGEGHYRRFGLLLFTVRNGLPGGKKSYCEKLMLVAPGQITPWHFHWQKVEDIINRGGGELVVELAWSTSSGKKSTRPVMVSCDGVQRKVRAGGKVILKPGESITLVQGQYHTFYGRKGAGKVLVGEVSAVNDDAADNRFLNPLPRFPKIEEDEPPLHLLCNEYPKAP